MNGFLLTKTLLATSSYLFKYSYSLNSFSQFKLFFASLKNFTDFYILGILADVNYFLMRQPSVFRLKFGFLAYLLSICVAWILNVAHYQYVDLQYYSQVLIESKNTFSVRGTERIENWCRIKIMPLTWNWSIGKQETRKHNYCGTFMQIADKCFRRVSWYHTCMLYKK